MSDFKKIPFNRKKFMLEEWPDALRSGKYKQTKEGKLLAFDEEQNETFCCLGVACDLLEKKGLLDPRDWENTDQLPIKAIELLKIDEEGCFCAEEFFSQDDDNMDYRYETLVNLNDNTNLGFEGIADLIIKVENEDNWEGV